MSKLFRLVIDTDSYAGNFERDMCAYLTGQVGECTVGSDIVKWFSSDIKHLEWWQKNIVKRSNPDQESKCKRPTTAYWNDKNCAYNSVAIYVKKIPSEDIFSEFKERISYYCANRNLINAKVNNLKILYPTQAESLLMAFGGMSNEIIDLKNVIDDKPIIVSGFRIFEGIKNEVLIKEFPFD